MHAERFWLPVLGPTALLAARNLHRRVPEPGDSAVVSMGELAAELGVGSRSGRNAPLVRSLARLLTFGAASLDGSAFLVAAAWPEVPERHRSRFPPSLAAEVASSHPVPH